MKLFCLKRLILIPAVLLCYATGAQAFERTYTAALTVTSHGGLSPDIQVGDRFLYRFTLDHAVTDTEASTAFADFAASMVEPHELLRAPANVGTWNPGASGTFSGGNMFTRNDQGHDAISPSPQASGFPAIGPNTLQRLVLNLEDSSETAVDDTGAGQTLEAQLGGALDPDDFPDGRSAALEFGEATVGLSVDNVVAVPPVAVPGLDGIALGIVVLGLGGLGTRMALARTRGEVTSS